jgi:hypothetical protein
MVLEDIAKIALENPDFTAATASTAAYSALTYTAGRTQNFTRHEAEEILEEGAYNNLKDCLKGLYGKGVSDACEAELDYRDRELPEEPDIEVPDIDSENTYAGGD